MAAGVIPDPYLDGNEDGPSVDVRHRLALCGGAGSQAVALEPTVPGERVDLVFDGIDTVGDRTAWGRPGPGRARPHLQHAPLVPLRHLASTSPAGPLGLEVDLHSATAYAEAERATARDRPEPVPGAVQLHSQDGLQLRLGLGARPAHRGPVEAGAAGAVERGPAGSGDAPGDPRRRGHRSGRAPDRPGAPRCGGTADAGRRDPGPPSRERGGRRGAPARRLSSMSPMRLSGGPSATASSRWPTSRSPCRRPTRNSIGGSGGWVSAPSNWTHPATRSAPRSPCRSTAGRCSSKVSTGSPMITS